MNKMRGAAAFAASVIAAAAVGGEPRASGYKSYALPDYTLITRDSSIAARLPAEVAKVDKLLAWLLKPSVHSGTPTFIFVVPHGVWKNYLKPGSGIVGEFVPGRFANYLLIDSSHLNVEGRGTVFHEYTHLYLWTRFRGVHPLWFDEGFAELMQHTTFKGTVAEVGLPDFRQTEWVPMQRLLVLDKSSAAYRNRTSTHQVHIQSWAMIHRGVIADREFGRQMFAFLAAQNAMQPVDQAMQLSFGMNARQLNSSMHGYLNKSRFRVARVDLGSSETVIVPPGRDVSEVETLQFLAEIMFTSGTQPHRLASVIEAARSRAPEWAAVQALRMRLAVRDRDDAALQQLLAEIEPRLADARAARSVGLALYERVRASESSHAPPAMDVGALSVRALDLLSRALAAEPDDVQVVCAYALLAAQLKQDIAGALNRVQKMRAHLPSNGELAMAAALLYDAQGEPQEVNPYLAEVVELSNWDEQRRWAALRLGRRSGDP